MTTVPKKHVLALRSDKRSEKVIIGGSKKRHRQVSNDSGFASQASSDDDQFFAVLDVSPENSFEFDVSMPPPVLGPIAPPKTRIGNKKVKKFDEVLSTMRREIEQLKPFTMTEATLEQMIGKYQHVKESLDILVEIDNRQQLLDIKKVFIHASLDVRFQYIDFAFMVLNLTMQNSLNNISRKRFSALFCGIMKHTEIILQTTLNLEQFNKLLDILDIGLSAFKHLCRTSVDHYHYASGIRKFVKACYAYLNAVEESMHFATLRQTQIDTLMRLFNEITMMFKNFCEIFNFTDAETTIIRLENVLSFVGKLHPWELLRRLLATIGTHLRMPEPVSSSKILLRLMGFIGHEGVSDDILSIPQTCTVARSPLKEQPPSPKTATQGGGGFVSMEDLLVQDVRINSGVFIPWRLMCGPQIQHPILDEFFDDENDQATLVPTSIPSWYVKKAKAPCHIEKGKKTKEKEMLKLRGTIAFPLSKARAPLTTWPEETILNDEGCILFGNGLP